MIEIRPPAEAAGDQIAKQEITAPEAPVIVAVGSVAPHIVLFVDLDNGEEPVIRGIVNVIVSVEVFPPLQGQPVAILQGADQDDPIALVDFVNPLLELGGTLGTLESLLNVIQVDPPCRAVGRRPVIVRRTAASSDEGRAGHHAPRKDCHTRPAEFWRHLRSFFPMVPYLMPRTRARPFLIAVAGNHQARKNPGGTDGIQRAKTGISQPNSNTPSGGDGPSVNRASGKVSRRDRNRSAASFRNRSQPSAAWIM